MIKRYLKRNSYLKKIEPFFDKNVIKVIVGQRRVGKSYLLFQVMDELVKKGAKRSDIIYINKELHEFEAIRDYNDLLAYVRKAAGNKKKYVIIDEIQDIAEFEKALRDLAAGGKHDIYCTGSNANLLSSELATYLSGRYVEIEVFSLAYPEFLIFHKLKNTDESLLQYIKYGGLPYLINLELTDQIVYDYLRNIYNTILFKDVVKRYNIRHLDFLERLVEYLADNTGSLVSAKKISDFLKSQKIKMAPNIVLNYIHFLASSFFIFKVRRSEVNGKKIFEINEKYYFEDLGLRHSLVGYRQTDISKVLENLIYMHLKASGYKITVGQLGEKEIDFVGERQGEKIYIQAAYLINSEAVKEREFGNLLAIKDNYPKLVVSMDKLAGGSFKGVKQINILDFLSKLL